MKPIKINNNRIFLHYNDLPGDIITGDIVAIDTETTGLSLHRDRLCLIQLCFENKDCHIVKLSQNLKNNESQPKNLSKILLDDQIEKIFHFARFDVGFIKKHLKINCRNIFCTKISSRLVRTYTDRHGLKDLIKDLLDIDISKNQQSTDWATKELTNNQIIYAAKDVFYLQELRNKLIIMLKREGRLDLAKSIFGFLDVRTDLDILGWQSEDIYSHSI